MKDNPNSEEKEQLLHAFEEKWPLKSLSEMTLVKYALGGENYKDSFSYWVETEADALGSVGGIGGGGSFKHGIFVSQKSYDDTKNLSDHHYAWSRKYGDNSSEAFEQIKLLLIQVAQAAKEGNWEAIDQIDFYNPVKWKWAFLYSNRRLFPVYKKEALQIAANELGYTKSNASYPELYDYLISQQREEESCFDLGARLWSIYLDNVPVNYYILGSKYGENADIDVFPKMFDRNVIATGFASGYDLEPYVGKTQKDIIAYLESKDEPSNSYNALKYFLNIKPGDKIAVKADGSPKGKKAFLSIIGIAEAIGDENYYEHDPGDLGHTIKVKWIKAPVYKEFELGYGRTIHKLNDKSVIDQIFKSEYITVPMSETKEHIDPATIQNNSLNQILYGPPGTGKTYNTIDIAVRIADPNGYSTEHSLNEKLFNALVEKGQIVFTTFHQSMSYEDFIEGIKPLEMDGGITYRVVDGLFKQIANRATYSLFKEDDQSDIDKHEYFDELFEKFLIDLQNRIDESEDILRLPLKSKGYNLKILSIDDDKILTQGGTAENSANVEKEKIRLLFNKFEKISDIQNVVEDIRGVGPGLGWSSNYYGIFKALKEFESTSDLSKSSFRKEVDSIKYEDVKSFIANLNPKQQTSLKIEKDIIKNYVLIIDEVNRGNVSSIFGELITLIEQNKRLGGTESRVAKLPYSKSYFGVPANLYIIGTMNTADRSVEALDSALRRRFDFAEIAPNSKIVEDVTIDGVNLRKVFDTINNRIEFLKDEDHTMGHAYYMNVKTPADLANTFNRNIVPLLKEYFFNDYGKIQLILGKGFVKKGIELDQNLFAESDIDVLPQDTFEFMPIKASNVVSALKKTLKQGE